MVMGPNVTVFSVVKEWSKNTYDRKKGKSKMYCKHCKGEGHSMENCFHIIGYLDW